MSRAPHDVEFFAVFPIEAAAGAVAVMFVADGVAGDPLVDIEARPSHRAAWRWSSSGACG